MSYSYDEIYLPCATRIMGDMFDYAVNTLGIKLDEFVKMFIVSNMSYQFEIGNPTYIAGKNGCEIAKEVVQECTGEYPDVPDLMYVDKSVEYWIGWALAGYQWYRNISYKKINECQPIIDMYGMYVTLHEADITTFYEIMDEKMNIAQKRNTLARLRRYAGLSQSQLARMSGVPLRQIQLFEQGYRDINKTQGNTLLQLADAMHVDIKELLV